MATILLTMRSEMALKAAKIFFPLSFKGLINLGTFDKSFSSANKVKTTNIIGIITTVISALYSLFFLFALNNTLVAIINLAFTSAYALTLAFNNFQAHRSSKVWFFSVLMLHLVVCTNIYVTNETGFHLYYFLVPTGVFLLFELNEKKEKIILSSIAVLLYFYCENTVNTSPLIDLSAQMNHIIYQSVIFINMVEVIIVMSIFASEIESNEAKLIKLAKTDALTGIANRHSFFEEGNTLFEASRQQKRPFSLIILDFDYFKSINDKYGHYVGDLCLIEISKLLQHECRTNDLLARIGGEEFAIALPETTMQEANNIAECMRIAIENHTIPIVGEKHFHCTASFGVTTKRSHHDGLKYLLIQADKALYLAKEQGRNRVHLFDANKQVDVTSA